MKKYKTLLGLDSEKALNHSKKNKMKETGKIIQLLDSYV